MSNIIQGFRPITYGPHEMKNEYTEALIRFLEDPANDDKPLPPNLFMPWQIQLINNMDGRTHVEKRRAYAEQSRESLLGHIEH